MTIEQAILDAAMKRDHEEWRIVLRCPGSGTRSAVLQSELMTRGDAEAICYSITENMNGLIPCVELDLAVARSASRKYSFEDDDE